MYFFTALMCTLATRLHETKILLYLYKILPKEHQIKTTKKNKQKKFLKNVTILAKRDYDSCTINGHAKFAYATSLFIIPTNQFVKLVVTFQE